MANYKVTDAELSGIASAIRTKGGTSASLLFPDGFISAISAIPSGGGGSAVLESLSVSQNGHYTPGSGVDGFNDVVVDVSGGGGSNNNFLIAIGASTGSIYDTEASAVRQSAFVSNNNVTGVEMTSVTQINTSAFYYCSSLQTASFPACTSVYGGAFGNCYALQTISFPVCTYIGGDAFIYCSSLQTASFPACTSVGGSLFNRCNSLSEVSFPSLLATGYTMFSSTIIEQLDLPVCTTIDHLGSPSLLREVSAPECTILSTYAFNACKSLSSVYLPKVENCYSSAFSGCTSLSTITLPMCSSFRNYVFNNCTKLESVYLLSNAVAKYGTGMFSNTPIVNSSYLGYFGSIYVPASLVDAYKASTGWSGLSDRITAYTE